MTPLSDWLVTHEMNEAAAAGIGIQISGALAKCHMQELSADSVTNIDLHN